jgi:hypothetical protein
MSVRIMLGVFLFVMAACSTTDWVNTQNPKANYTLDYNECESQASQNPKTQVGSKLMIAREVDRCLMKKGWVQREMK